MPDWLHCTCMYVYIIFLIFAPHEKKFCDLEQNFLRERDYQNFSCEEHFDVVGEVHLYIVL